MIVFFSITNRAPYPANISDLFPLTSAECDYFRSNFESRKAGISELFAGVSRELSSVLSGHSAPAADKMSKVARITELSQTIQSRLRGPMQELGRHLECEQ